MQTYQQTASSNRGGTDVAAWGLVALVVVVICAGAGWAIARQDTPSGDDVAKSSELAARQGAAQGLQSGYAAGARAGRTQAALLAKQRIASERQAATREGYAAGYAAGRDRAEARANGFASSSAVGLTSGADALPGYEDVLASGFGADVPGYATSAYPGYGSTASTSAYPSTSLLGATQFGDDF